jgi:cytochrome c oxidase cbb3-type subunit III
MQINKGVAAAGLAGLLTFVAHGAAQGPAQKPPAGTPQTPAPQTPAPQTPAPAPAGRGQGRGGGRAVFPAQQRPPADPAVVARGKVVYTGTCSSCHGIDARGGQLGGPNLLRSQLVLNDRDGELIGPIIHGARAERGMPPIPMTDDDIKAVAAFLHSLQAAARPQGAPPDSGTPPPDALVGDAAAGQQYFAAKCSTCHTPEKLQGIATKYPEAKLLQNAWVSGGAGGGRGRGGRGSGPTITAVVTQPNGQKVEGRLVRIDDFLVTLQLAADTIRTFRRQGEQPKVEIHDPLAGHKALLGVLTDKDMHDVTAYLATLK